MGLWEHGLDKRGSRHNRQAKTGLISVFIQNRKYSYFAVFIALSLFCCLYFAVFIAQLPTGVYKTKVLIDRVKGIVHMHLINFYKTAQIL